MNKGLDDERRVAARTVSALVGHRAWLWEDDAAAGVARSDDECVAIAASSDGLVLLLADELSDITRREYAAAKESGAQRYVMIKTTAELDEPARLFVASERDGDVVTRNFASKGELRTHLQRSLMASFVKASRESQLARRGIEMGPARISGEDNDG